MKKKKGLKVLLVLVLSMFLVGLVSTAVADVLCQCVGQTGRSPRYVDVTKECRPYETKVCWSIEGPPGPQGPEGPQGTCTCPISEQDWLDLLARVKALELALCVPETELCNDGIDNDCDSYTDCDDEDDCSTSTACQECPDPFEPNDSRDLATDLGSFATPQLYEATLSMDPFGDKDYFEFKIVGGRSPVQIAAVSAPGTLLQIDLLDPTTLIPIETGSNSIQKVLDPGSYLIRIAGGKYYGLCYSFRIRLYE